MSTWYVTPSDKDLVHYGVLGMKWGVRKYQNIDGSLTDAGKRRYQSKETKATKAIRSGLRTTIGTALGGPLGGLIGLASAQLDSQEKINQRRLENDMRSIQLARLRDSARTGRNDLFPMINEQSQTATNLYKAVKGSDVSEEEVSLALKKAFREAEIANDRKTMFKIVSGIGMAVLGAAGAIKAANDYKEDGDLEKLISNSYPGVKQLNGAEYIGEKIISSTTNLANIIATTVNDLKQSRIEAGKDVWDRVLEDVKDISDVDMEIELRNWKKDDGGN